MNVVFADTSYFLAFLGDKDQCHHRAIAWTQALRATVVTTEYVVIEVGNSLTKGGDRAVFVDFYGRRERQSEAGSSTGIGTPGPRR